MQALAWINHDTWDKGDFTMHENEAEVYMATPELDDRSFSAHR